MILHAGLVALYGPGGWRGALIEGPSGSGKSDLALRALDLGLALVADDRTLVWPCEGRLFGAAPGPLGGLIESRGLGILRLSRRALSEIHLIVACEPEGQAIERLPEPEIRPLFGIGLPLLRLHALNASAPVKLRLALSHLGAEPQGGYDAATAPAGAEGTR